jgi:hypothetical protein
LELQRPLKYLLVSKAVQGSREAVQASRVGVVGIRECGSDKMSGVRGDVTTLVIAMDGDVQAHKLIEGVAVWGCWRRLRLTRGGEAEHAVEVGTVVQGRVRVHDNTVVEGAAVDERQLGDDIQGVLKHGVPIVLFVDAVLVSVSELAFSLAGENSDRELRHGVHA